MEVVVADFGEKLTIFRGLAVAGDFRAYNMGTGGEQGFSWVA